MTPRPYRWLVVLFGLPALLVALSFVIGALLPKEHVAAARVELQASPDAVWSTITDFASQARWRSDVDSMEALPDDPAGQGWREHPASVGYRITAMDPPHTLVTTIIPGLPFGGTWTYTLESAGNGSVLTIVEHGRVDPALFRFMARFVFGHHSTLETYLNSLGEAFGEPVTVERVTVS